MKAETPRTNPMTQPDEISKMVPPVHSVTFVPSFSEAARTLGHYEARNDQPAIDHWRSIVDAHETAASAALRIESPTPAEARGEDADIAALRELMGLLPPFAKDPNILGNPTHFTNGLFVRLGDIRRLAVLLPTAVVAIATLARQLAWAEEKAKTAEDFAAQAGKNRIRAEQAEAQLAQATARLAAVEGLAGKWRDDANIDASLGADHMAEATRNCARELDAALQPKEPQHND